MEQRASYNDSYFMSLTYDMNGNIETMTRKGTSATALAMDVLQYNYEVKPSYGKNTNKLRQVDDNVAGSVYTNDIEGQVANNYSYDDIGQLISDDQECIATIEWTPYRKVSKVLRSNACQVNGTYPSDLEFEYNAQQQRIMKLEKPRDGSGNLLPEDQWKYTYYSYDATGNILAIYERTYASTGTGAWEDQLKVKGFELYASSHIGTYGPATAYQVAAVPFTATVSGGVFTSRVNSSATTTAVDNTHLERTLGNRMYQLANHLGNVLSVVADRKLQVDGNNDNLVDNYLADVLSSTDYYPFGQEMPGRTFSSNRYRYGYNGMEKDDEMGKGSGNSYTTDFRMYDPRVGRWLSQDPIVHEWESPYAAFANNPIYFADPSGLQGEGTNQPAPSEQYPQQRFNNTGNVIIHLLDSPDEQFYPKYLEDTKWDYVAVHSIEEAYLWLKSCYSANSIHNFVYSGHSTTGLQLSTPNINPAPPVRIDGAAILTHDASGNVDDQKDRIIVDINAFVYVNKGFGTPSKATKDATYFKLMGEYLAPDATVVFTPCGSGREETFGAELFNTLNGTDKNITLYMNRDISRYVYVEEQNAAGVLIGEGITAEGDMVGGWVKYVLDANTLNPSRVILGGLQQPSNLQLNTSGTVSEVSSPQYGVRGPQP